jgi:hypothetical protein
MVNGETVADGEEATTTLFNQMFPVHISRTSVSADLSGSAVTLVCIHAERALTLKKATLLYTEASSADAGITLEIGKESDRDYYYTGTSEISKSVWYSKDLDLLQTSVTAGDTVTFYSPGSKSGAGEVMLIIEYYYTVS